MIPNDIEALIADNLEPWWRCAHPLEPMGVAMEIGHCGRCESERKEVAEHLGIAIRASGAA